MQLPDVGHAWMMLRREIQSGFIEWCETVDLKVTFLPLPRFDLSSQLKGDFCVLLSGSKAPT
jgi:hypothetical protein